MMLYGEIHRVPADQADDDNVEWSFDADRETFQKELAAQLHTLLEDPAEGDELIVTITVRDLEE